MMMTTSHGNTHDSSNSGSSSSPQQKHIVFEIAGGSGIGKTSLVTSLAASYVAATSHLIHSSVMTSPTPQVVILDYEYGIHACQLTRVIC